MYMSGSSGGWGEGEFLPPVSKLRIAFCRDRLARFKCPRNVVFCELPKTSTGKVQKFELRKKAETV